MKTQNAKRQFKTLNQAKKDLVDYFKNPGSPRQRHYEAIRAIAIDGESIETVANRYGYKVGTVYSLIRDAKAGKLELFPAIKKGPRQKRTKPEVQNRIIEFRKMNLSTTDIQVRLAEESIKISSRTVERILKESGFRKLKRYRDHERYSCQFAYTI